MFTTRDLQDEILRLKKEHDVCILAHAYQSHDILEVADYTGDSYGLSLQAAKAPQKTVLMCGVRFMAETCKILSPEKRVYLPRSEAGCPMAEQLDIDMLRQLLLHLLDNHLIAHTGHHFLAYLTAGLAEILLHLLFRTNLRDIVVHTHIHLMAHR